MPAKPRTSAAFAPTGWLSPGKPISPCEVSSIATPRFPVDRDQDGPLEDIWRYGLDAARMDWIGNGDHDNGGGREYTWWLTQKLTDVYHHAPTFTPMFTYERSVVYPTATATSSSPARHPPPAAPGYTTAAGGARGSTTGRRHEDALPLPQALRRHLLLAHQRHQHGHRLARQRPGSSSRSSKSTRATATTTSTSSAPKAAKDAPKIGGYQPEGFVWNAFDKGYKLGFQVSSDHVSTHMSYGIVLPRTNPAKGFIDAFKKRHCYGATDNIILDVRSGDQMMGDEFTLRVAPRLDIRAIGTAPIARIDIVRQIDKSTPAYVYATEPKIRDVKISWTDSNAKEGALNMYYVRLTQEDGKLAWASPMWIKYERAPR